MGCEKAQVDYSELLFRYWVPALLAAEFFSFFCGSWQLKLSRINRKSGVLNIDNKWHKLHATKTRRLKKLQPYITSMNQQDSPCTSLHLENTYMAHLIDTMAYTGQTPWHGLGNLLPPQQSLDIWL